MNPDYGALKDRLGKVEQRAIESFKKYGGGNGPNGNFELIGYDLKADQSKDEEEIDHIQKMIQTMIEHHLDPNRFEKMVKEPNNTADQASQEIKL